jgi:hypothetical protein
MKSRRKSRRKSRMKSRRKSRRRRSRGGFFGWGKKTSPTYYYDAGTGRATTIRPVGRMEAAQQVAAREADTQNRSRMMSMRREDVAKYTNDRNNKKYELGVRYTEILNKLNDHRAQIRKLEGQLAQVNQEEKIFNTPQRQRRVTSHTYDPNLIYM